MLKNHKLGKISAVILITILIWVWADLALDATFESQALTVTISKASTDQLLVNFDENQPTIKIEKVIFKGPAARISIAQRKFNDGSFDTRLFLDPQKQNMTKADTYPLDLLSFLRQNQSIKKLGITVESCLPEKVTVNVTELVKKQLNIQCVDEDRLPINTSAIEPSKISMFVPDQWSGEALLATVQLTRLEIEKSKLTGNVSKTPFIELNGLRREAQTPVKISISPEQDNLNDYTIEKPILGITLSTTLLKGKYQVKVLNENKVMGTINISATAEAKTAYQNSRYHVILEIYDDDIKDKKPGEQLRRKLLYNFPPEFIASGEIKLKDTPTEAKFTLTPVTTTPAP